MSTYRNKLVTAISNAPGLSGALTIAAAASGYRTFGAGDDGLSFDVSITDGTAWEIRTGCVYTHAGTSLARGTLEDSSTGSAIALSAAAVVTLALSAADATRLADTSGTNTGDQDLSGKQDTLVSGTNIKTINGTTLLGSGDVAISGGGASGLETNFLLMGA